MGKSKSKRKIEKQNKKSKNIELVNKSIEEFSNTAGDMGNVVFNFPTFGLPNSGNQLSQIDTILLNERWYMISNLRQPLSELYAEHGMIQTLVDQPVDDAFRGGYKIKSEQLSEEEIKILERWVEHNYFNPIFAQGSKWTRLFGGGGIVILTGQVWEEPLKELKEGDYLSFRAVDLWELFYNKQNTTSDYQSTDFNIDTTQEGFFFDYYGKKLHPSRVFLLKGKEPPSFIRPRMRGWGMSEIERVIGPYNLYLKIMNVIFEIIDEAKIDVFSVQGFNSALLNKNAAAKVQEAIQRANMSKNYNNALVLDANDKWDQKQLNFAGLAEIIVQIRQFISGELKIPVSKLFGTGSSGFSSGEDDIENYNAMVESEVRTKVKYYIVNGLELVCEVLFGFHPDDLEIEFNPLRILSAEQEETVKEKRTNRLVSLFGSGLISAKEAKQAINRDNLIPIKVEENDEIYDNPSVDPAKQTGVNIESSKADSSQE